MIVEKQGKKGESERGGTRKKKYRLQEEEAAARDIVKIKYKKKLVICRHENLGSRHFLFVCF